MYDCNVFHSSQKVSNRYLRCFRFRVLISAEAPFAHSCSSDFEYGLPPCRHVSQQHGAQAPFSLQRKPDGVQLSWNQARFASQAVSSFHRSVWTSMAQKNRSRRILLRLLFGMPYGKLCCTVTRIPVAATTMDKQNAVAPEGNSNNITMVSHTKTSLS